MCALFSASMTGSYQISATDYENFMILEGCVPVSDNKGNNLLIFVVV